VFPPRRWLIFLFLASPLERFPQKQQRIAVEFAEL